MDFRIADTSDSFARLTGEEQRLVTSGGPASEFLDDLQS